MHARAGVKSDRSRASSCEPMKPTPLVLLVAGAGLLLATGAFARGSIDASTGLPEADMGDVNTSDNPDDNDETTGNEIIMSDDLQAMLAAFIHMIVACEHKAADVANGNAYYVFFGGTYFTDLSDHPVLTGERKGVPLSHDVCVAAGFADGICVSTAAGALQFTVPTWNEIREYDGPRLPDFSVQSQNEAGRRLLKKIGALDLLFAGDVEGAIRRASQRWASLPGSNAKQNPKPMNVALAHYNEGFA